LQSRFDHIAPALARLCDRQLEVMASMHTPDDRLIWSSVVASRFGRDKAEAADLIQGLRRHFKSRPILRETALWNELKFTADVAQAEDSETLRTPTNNTLGPYTMDSSMGLRPATGRGF
jgi:hypothetical protein